MSFLAWTGAVVWSAVALYAGVFLLWIILMTACLTTGAECGGDILTSLVRTLYGPLLGV